MFHFISFLFFITSTYAGESQLLDAYYKSIEVQNAPRLEYCKKLGCGNCDKEKLNSFCFFEFEGTICCNPIHHPEKSLNAHIQFLGSFDLSHPVDLSLLLPSECSESEEESNYCIDDDRWSKECPSFTFDSND